ncbi:MAG TPA: class I SAM-dependent methyltransferase [Pyrinomonadaceae bacterium]
MATLLREMFASPQFDRIPESDLIMDSEEAVAAFARAGQPNGILSGVYAFYIEQACKMIRPGDRVLDLGCGPALLLASIAALNQGVSFIGVDCSAPMIARGNEALQRMAAKNVDLRIDDMTELGSIEPGSIDVVLSSMAMHHLPDTGDLHSCFDAIERVMAPNARVFVSDFGRLKSLKSIEYFVRRAIPPDEPVLERDYRASLRAAFSWEEFNGALSQRMKQRVSLYATVLSPMMVVVMTPFPAPPQNLTTDSGRILQMLPRNRRADYRQLRLSLSLGGMPC